MESSDVTLGRNLVELRRVRNHTVRSLAARLDELGCPISPSGITKIENADRQARTDELLALAVALKVNPSRLLLTVHRAEVEVTPNLHVSTHEAWAWADGRAPLWSAVSDDEQRDDVVRDFELYSRPPAARVMYGHNAMQAAEDVTTRLELLLDGEPEDPKEGGLEQVEERITRIQLAMTRLQAEVDDLAHKARQTARDLHGKR